MEKYILTRGQIWGLDLITALLIFFMGLFFFYFYILTPSNDSQPVLDKLSREGNFIADKLMSEGVPSNWTTSTVIEPGIVDDNKVNETKASMFYNLSLSDYTSLRHKFKTDYDFYFYLSEPINVSEIFVDGIGKPGINRTNLREVANPENIVRVERVVLYNNKLTKLNIFVWGK